MTTELVYWSSRRRWRALRIVASSSASAVTVVHASAKSLGTRSSSVPIDGKVGHIMAQNGGNKTFRGSSTLSTI